MLLEWTELAADDLDQIEEYIMEESSPVAATDVVLEIIDGVELLLSGNPHSGRPGRLSGTRELVIGRLPFIVIYRVVASVAQSQILRVMHDSQRWPSGA